MAEVRLGRKLKAPIGDIIQRLAVLQTEYYGKPVTEEIHKEMVRLSSSALGPGAGVTFILKSYQDQQEFNLLVSIMQSAFPLFSKKYIDGFLMRYLADPTIPTKGEADLRLRIDEEQKKLTETATVSIPLTRQESGIELKLPSIQIGPCEILQGDSPGGIVIKTVVRACDSDRFNELADESLDEMYDILTLLTGEKNLQPRFCVKTKIYRIEKKDGGTESHSIDYGHSINPMIINEKFVEFFERSKLLSTINEIYTSDPKQRYNKKIKLAMRWFGSALRTERKVITYLHLIEVFETLLKNNEERQELKRIIQQRAAFILKTRYNYDVVDIHRFIGEAYSKRSTIIHQGDMDETDEKNIQTLEAIARTIIFDFLHRHNALKDFGPAEYKAFFEKMDEEILESLQFMQSDKAQQTGSAVETKKANGL